jgi:hypothetical protein
VRISSRTKCVFLVSLVLFVAYVSLQPMAAYAATSTVTYVVALDGSGDYKDIQSAVNAVPTSSNGIILVKEGRYDLNPQTRAPVKSILVRSNLVIRGAGIDKTIVRLFTTKQPYGSEWRAPVFVSKSSIQNLAIENLTVIQNGTPDNMGWNAIDLRGGTNTNVNITNVKVTDVTGAGISIPRFSNIRIENCIVSTAQTGINVIGGSNGLIKGNRIVDTAGNGIFPRPLESIQLNVADLVIDGNYVENAGDTGIDVTSITGIPPHERITVQGNTLKDSRMRVSYSNHVKILRNTVIDGYIAIDAGQQKPTDIVVEGNWVNTTYKVAIGFYGAQDSRAVNNVIYLRGPSGSVQCGISAGIWGTGLIEGNTIVGSANYGIDFASWGIGNGHQITIRNNTLIDFNSIGIYDNNQNQGPTVVENNIIWDRRQPFVSTYGIRTATTSNAWTIRYNRVYAGKTAYISAPNSNLQGNIYEPPSTPPPIPSIYILNVNSAHGSPTPTTGSHTYQSGTSVACSVTSPVTEGGTTYTCTGWTGSGSVPSSGTGKSVTFTITRDSGITWNWNGSTPPPPQSGWPSSDDWTNVYTSAGETAQIVTTRVFSGSSSARFTSDGSTDYEGAYWFTSVSPTNEVWCEGYVNVDVSGIREADDRFFFIRLRSTSSNDLAFAGWRYYGGKTVWCLIVRNGNGYVVAYSTASPQLDSWYDVRLHWVGSSTAGYGELYVNGTAVASTSATPANTLQLGSCTAAYFGLAQIVKCSSTTVYGDEFTVR